jgi:hypothetical protein
MRFFIVTIMAAWKKQVRRAININTYRYFKLVDNIEKFFITESVRDSCPS